MRFNRETFYNAVRSSPFSGSLSQDQVNGMNAMLTTWEKFRSDGDLRYLAYMLATDFHETAYTMQPIEEYGKGSGRDYGKPDPETGQTYYGRGLVQLTWRENYARADKELNTMFGYMVGMEYDAAKALKLLVAVGVMFLGMEQGWFTSKKLSQYFNDEKNDAKNARQIINGNDKDTTIEGYHYKFLDALELATVEGGPSPVEGNLVVINLQVQAPPGITVQVHLDGDTPAA